MLKKIIGHNANRERLLLQEKVKAAKKISQDELAARVPMQPSHLSRVERGVQNATMETLWRLEAALHLKRYELFNENGGKEGAKPCYATLNRFARQTIHRKDGGVDTKPSHLLDSVEKILLEKMTIEDIEREAAKWQGE